MSVPGPDPRRAVAWIVVALATVAVAIGGLGTTPARAHPDVDFTLPVEGAAVGEPVSEVSVGFTQPVTLIGPGFEVLDPQGNVVIPSVVTDDDQVFRLQLDPPLAGGEAAVRWEVRAEDGHTITGGFAFTISVDAVTTTLPPAPDPTPPAPDPTAGATAATITTITGTSPVSSTIAAPAAPGSDDSTPTVPDSEAPSETVDPPKEVDPNGSSGMYFVLAGVVVIAAAAFVAIRSRVSAST